MLKSIAIAVGALAALGLAVFKWYMSQHSATAKKEKELYENVADKIDNDASAGDVQSSIDDLRNRL